MYFCQAFPCAIRLKYTDLLVANPLNAPPIPLVFSYIRLSMLNFTFNLFFNQTDLLAEAERPVTGLKKARGYY